MRGSKTVSSHMRRTSHKYKNPDKGTSGTESHGTCPECGKQKFSSRKEARLAARRIFPGATMREYQCGDWWHHTSADSERTAYLRRKSEGSGSLHLRLQHVGQPPGRGAGVRPD